MMTAFSSPVCGDPGFDRNTSSVSKSSSKIPLSSISDHLKPGISFPACTSRQLSEINFDEKSTLSSSSEISDLLIDDLDYQNINTVELENPSHMIKNKTKYMHEKDLSVLNETIKNDLYQKTKYISYQKRGTSCTITGSTHIDEDTNEVDELLEEPFDCKQMKPNAHTKKEKQNFFLIIRKKKVCSDSPLVQNSERTLSYLSHINPLLKTNKSFDIIKDKICNPEVEMSQKKSCAVLEKKGDYLH
ncbi:hypothetical protein CEXT_86751 [Caerostris extrusa]|uniref:Uncharacterized protein n=1 Tax=Caerostris extrusa TaxID=172846 RepID=A0AAV4Y616_CAEEX|nr:hypothetical protein CEXT_86751 [Caerostris extrusa]